MPEQNNPKISIITASYEAKDTLEKTIESVAAQTYPHKEHLIIDGGSKDGTGEMLKSLSSKLKFVSEKDQGISDAFNKGIKLSTGDYLYFLGAGDTFVDENVLSNIFTNLSSRPMLICGKVLRVTEEGKPLWQAPKKWPKQFNKKGLLRKLTLPHQGLFMHRAFFERFGLFDLECQFAMDYEILLRAYHQFPDIQLVPQVVAHWQAGGIGKGRILEIYDEYRRIKKKYQVASDASLWRIDRWNRLKYKFKTLITPINH